MQQVESKLRAAEGATNADMADAARKGSEGEPLGDATAEAQSAAKEGLVTDTATGAFSDSKEAIKEMADSAKETLSAAAEKIKPKSGRPSGPDHVSCTWNFA